MVERLRHAFTPPPPANLSYFSPVGNISAVEAGPRLLVALHECRQVLLGEATVTIEVDAVLAPAGPRGRVLPDQQAPGAILWINTIDNQP